MKDKQVWKKQPFKKSPDRFCSICKSKVVKGGYITRFYKGLKAIIICKSKECQDKADLKIVSDLGI